MAFSEKDLNQYRRKLLEMKAELEEGMEAADGIARHQSLSDTVHELSLYDNHPADLGSENYERGKDLALHERRLLELQEIDGALDRIDRGSYGTCAECGRSIPRERLQAVPYTALCRQCQEQAELPDKKDNPRPVEEGVLATPFARSYRDDKDYTGFDGEDSWQALARYGTAESPQDVPGAEDFPPVDGEPEARGTVDIMDHLPSDHDPEAARDRAEDRVDALSRLKEREKKK